MDERLLISLVRNYPLLYDLTSPLYNDQQKKDEAWNEIGASMSASAYDCKVKWTRLRDNYRKALLVRCKSNGRIKDRAVKHEKELSFLKEKFVQRKRIKIDLGNNLESPKESPNVPTLYENTSSQMVDSKEEQKKQIVTKKSNDLNIFFEGIAETVKKFPNKIQVQMKRQIFNLVNDTEASLLDNEIENIYFSTPSVEVLADQGVCGSMPSLASEANQEYIPKPEKTVEFEIDNIASGAHAQSTDYDAGLSIKDEII